MDTVRIGVLGAAIAPAAVIRPARADGRGGGRRGRGAGPRPGRHVRGEARDPAGARLTTTALIADPDIDAVYNPLPNGLHARVDDRRARSRASTCSARSRSPRTPRKPSRRRRPRRAPASCVMEAFHWRYHPLAQRMLRDRRAAASSERCATSSASMCFPLPMFSDIRYQYDLAGGALMDAGCYAVHMVRHARRRGTRGGERHAEAARSRRRPGDARRAAGSRPATPAPSTCSMWSTSVLKSHARVVGERGELRVFNPTNPQMCHRVRVTVDGQQPDRARPPRRRPTTCSSRRSARRCCGASRR